MKKIHSRVFVGNQDDFEDDVIRRTNWYVVHACKEPYHRDLLGYSGRGAPKNHPEYLYAKRTNALFLNLIDADDPKYIPKEIIDIALDQIDIQTEIGRSVLVHCNQGESRGPTIGLLYLRAVGLYPEDNYLTAKKRFARLYPKYNPAKGMELFAKKHWDYYKGIIERHV